MSDGTPCGAAWADGAAHGAIIGTCWGLTIGDGLFALNRAPVGGLPPPPPPPGAHASLFRLALQQAPRATAAAALAATAATVGPVARNAAGFGFVLGGFNAMHCAFERARGKKDPFNRGLAGVLVGGFSVLATYAGHSVGYAASREDLADLARLKGPMPPPSPVRFLSAALGTGAACVLVEMLMEDEEGRR
jgi:hypothetical protein